MTRDNLPGSDDRDDDVCPTCRLSPSWAMRRDRYADAVACERDDLRHRVQELERRLRDAEDRASREASARRAEVGAALERANAAEAALDQRRRECHDCIVGAGALRAQLREAEAALADEKRRGEEIADDLGGRLTVAEAALAAANDRASREASSRRAEVGAAQERVTVLEQRCAQYEHARDVDATAADVGVESYDCGAVGACPDVPRRSCGACIDRRGYRCDECSVSDECPPATRAGSDECRRRRAPAA